ncbi:MAG: tRNA (5-methylaminomethyl-2-thiouridine)(34)-methyltransferase MnmD [Porphyromonadaceae bacterium]|nr:tRNA (5-methylaminomethyl-2-thiouridine)(34)-methyltransferase MnmD [Porphyromonadaceae bacterium]
MDISQPQIELRQTHDGSSTLYNVTIGEHYHSLHGALQESQHIFLKAALEYRASRDQVPLSILEVGFGTGLNALLTFLWAERMRRSVTYTTLELYPISPELAGELVYELEGISSERIRECLCRLHAAPWGEVVELTSYFRLFKQQIDLRYYEPRSSVDVVYFDAFSPDIQPELWMECIFDRLYRATAPGGVLTTYSAKGEVRRRLQRAGYQVERLAGPIGKREILRASKH